MKTDIRDPAQRSTVAAKFRVLPAAASAGVIAAVDALGRAERRRADFVGESIGRLVPPSWDGVGAVPVGWSVPHGVLAEPGGARVAIVATNGFAALRPQFADAVDALPADWRLQ